MVIQSFLKEINDTIACDLTKSLIDSIKVLPGNDTSTSTVPGHQLKGQICWSPFICIRSMKHLLSMLDYWSFLNSL